MLPPAPGVLTAADLARLHECRTGGQLDARFAADLESLLPGTDVALCETDAAGRPRVRLAVGTRWRPSLGARLDLATATTLLPISYRQHRIGMLAVARRLDAREEKALEDALAHYGAALANLTLSQEAQRDAIDYYSLVQALEQGIVLFQEEDPEILKARLLQQTMSIVEAEAGALYVLRAVGDKDSGLVCDQVLGIPEEVLAGFAGAAPRWPDGLLANAAQVFERGADGSLARLPAEQLPAVLRAIAVLPLRYHGVEAGLCLLFNPRIDVSVTRQVDARLQSFGLLGAALLHRLRLEADHAINRSRERELQIARTIQQRLLPSAAPDSRGFEFAWCVLTAQTIGGDYLDVFEPRPGTICGIVADASGHGITSALLMSSFRATYRATAAGTATDELAAWLDDVVCNEVGPTGMFVTAVLYELDRESRRLRLTSAGHTPTMVFRARDGSVALLESHGPPLGFVAGARYGCDELLLEPGDAVLLYTDGVTEAANEAEDLYGEERLAAALRRHGREPAEDLLLALRTDVQAFTGRERCEDDLSLFVIRVG